MTILSPSVIGKLTGGNLEDVVAVSKRTRFEVFKRDKFQCMYCGRSPPVVILEVDHIVAVANGGPDSSDNLATACFDCNRGKSDVPLGSAPRPLAEVMAEAAEKQEQMEAYNAFLMEQRKAEDDRIEMLGRLWHNPLAKPKDQDCWVFANSRVTSIRTFIRRMPVTSVIEAMELSQQRVQASLDRDGNRWKYFCKVCWNMIRDLEGARSA